MTTGEDAMIPDGWQPPPPGLAADAKQKAMEALRTDGAHAAQHRLARFYDTGGDYAELASSSSARSIRTTSPPPICSQPRC